MHYLNSAPKSPQQGGQGPPRPPHFYKYAEPNNPQPNTNVNPMQFQHSQIHPQKQRPDPYSTNALPEDNTIEQIEQSSENKSQNLLTILLIGIAVVIFLGGVGIGTYFLVRHKPQKGTAHHKQKAPPKTPIESSSYDSAEQASHENADESQGISSSTSHDKHGTQIIQSGSISVYQIYFRAIQIPNEFIQYHQPQHPFLYDELSTLQGIADLFQNNKWNKEDARGNTIPITAGLCEYLEGDLQPMNIEARNNIVSLCNNRLQLMENPEENLQFIILSNKHLHKYPKQRGKTLELSAIVFKDETQRNFYKMNWQELNRIIVRRSRQKERRRLVKTWIPSMQSIVDNRDLWIPLPNDYRGSIISELKTSNRQMNPTDNDGFHYRMGNVHQTLQSPRDAPALNYRISFSQSRSQKPQSKLDEGTLSDLYFVSIRFQLVIGTPDGKSEVWDCDYEQRQTSQDGMDFDDDDDDAYGEDAEEEEEEQDYDYDGEDIDRKISLQNMWWQRVLQSPKTACQGHKSSRSGKKTEKPCMIIDRYHRVPTYRGRDRMKPCDLCLVGCEKERWEIVDDANRLMMINCDADIHVREFRTELTTDKQHLDLNNFERAYVYKKKGRVNVQQRTRIISVKGIPYLPYTLQEKDEEDTELTESRRVLLIEDKSSAFNTNNMYMIIGSTIFCIVIGIQSFYWLSHS